MTSLRNTHTGQTITVPDDTAAAYIAQGWTIPGADTDPGLDSLTITQLRDFASENGVDLTGLRLKAAIVTAIETALGPTA